MSLVGVAPDFFFVYVPIFCSLFSSDVLGITYCSLLILCVGVSESDQDEFFG